MIRELLSRITISQRQTQPKPNKSQRYFTIVLPFRMYWHFFLSLEKIRWKRYQSVNTTTKITTAFFSPGSWYLYFESFQMCSSNWSYIPVLRYLRRENKKERGKNTCLSFGHLKCSTGTFLEQNPIKSFLPFLGIFGNYLRWKWEKQHNQRWKINRISLDCHLSTARVTQKFRWKHLCLK